MQITSTQSNGVLLGEIIFLKKWSYCNRPIPKPSNSASKLEQLYADFPGWFQGKSAGSGVSESQSIAGLLKCLQITQMQMVFLLDIIASRVVSIHVNNCRPLRFGFLCLCEFSYVLLIFSEEK